VFASNGAPFVPEHLNDDAQACAEHIIRNFSSKCISAIDSYCTAVFAAAWAWHKAAVHEMSSPGFKADLAHGIIGVPGASFQKPAR
jgi:hypothetical protein